MKKIIFFLVGLILIFLVITVLSLLLPSKISITKSIEIEAPSEEVYSVLEDFKTWPKWFPSMQDSLLIIDYSSAPAAVSIKDTKGKELKLEILNSGRDTINIAVISSSTSRVIYQFILISKDYGHTQLVFNINTYFKWYPWEKAKGLFADKMAGPYYQNALIQLKRWMEG